MQLPNPQQIKELINQAKTVFVIVGPDANFDELAGASALFSGLQIADKDVKFLSPKKLKQSFDISNLEEIKTEVGHQNLLVSFDYSEEAVDKVSYHIGEETNKFYLTIKPKKDHEPLSADTVEFSYTGADADLVFLVGVSSLEDLEQLYFGYEKLYQDKAVVSMYEYPTGFGTVQLDISEVVGYSELVAQLMSETELHIDGKSATHLLAGIEKESRGFKSLTTTADTFEVVARLLRSGAERTEEKMVDSASQRTNEESAKKGKSQEISIKQGKNRSKNNHQDKSQKNITSQGSLNYQPKSGEGGTHS